MAGTTPINIRIYSVFEWGAKPPKQGRENLVVIPKAKEIIFHHTAGHVANISDPSTQSLKEAFQYARDIQAYHMNVNGWIDSGHSFLVTRGGYILQGRHLTINTIESGMMVLSAHCVGHNGAIGIEHEHKGQEEMTAKQREASAKLQAWIAFNYLRKTVLPVYPHSKYNPTSCPANLVGDIAAIRRRANVILTDALDV